MQILIDSSFLCNTSHFAGFTNQKNNKGIIFNYLNVILDLKESYRNYGIKEEINFVFLFDSRTSKRKEIFPLYKAKRKLSREAMSEEEKENMRNMYRQLDEIKTVVLPKLGFKNIFEQDGYEADDLFGELVRTSGYEKILMISSDNDLYQLLDHNVSMLVPKRDRLGTPYTLKRFTNEYKITPKLWLDAKILWGCHSDNIPPICPRCGEKTAISYLQGTLNPKNKIYNQIKENICREQFVINKKIIKLPMEGVIPMEVQSDELNIENFENLFKEYDFQEFLIERFDEWENFMKKSI